VKLLVIHNSRPPSACTNYDKSICLLINIYTKMYVNLSSMAIIHDIIRELIFCF
jgi:hypothetical protein